MASAQKETNSTSSKIVFFKLVACHLEWRSGFDGCKLRSRVDLWSLHDFVPIWRATSIHARRNKLYLWKKISQSCNEPYKSEFGPIQRSQRKTYLNTSPIIQGGNRSGGMSDSLLDIYNAMFYYFYYYKTNMEQYLQKYK